MLFLDHLNFPNLLVDLADGNLSHAPLLQADALRQWKPPDLIVVGWLGEALCWQCDGLQDVYQVLVDHVPVHSSSWRFEEPTRRLYATPKLSIHDGLPHFIQVHGHQRGLAAKLTTRYVAGYRFGLDVVESGRLVGFIYDEATPNRTIRLHVELEDGIEIVVEANQPRPGSDGAALAGFEVRWRPRAAGPRAETVALRVSDTGFYPFGRLRVPPPLGISEHVSAPSYRCQGPMRVLVIVAARADAGQTIACCKSLLAIQNDIGFEILLLDGISTAFDDGSPADAPLVSIAHDTGLIYQRASDHQDFAGALRAAVKRRPDHDVVILDPAILLSSGWLDRLYRASKSAPNVATAVPMMEFGGDYNGKERLESLNAGLTCEGPASGGSCVYLSRQALNEAGELGRECLEQVQSITADFMCRTSLLGWYQVVAVDVLARRFLLQQNLADMAAKRDQAHLNEIFSDFYRPDVVAERATPLRRARNRIQIDIWREKGEPIALLVTLAMPGGTLHHVLHLTHELQAQGYLVLWLQCPETYAAIQILEPPSNTNQAKRGGLVYVADGCLDEICADIFALQPRFIHIHHLIDIPDGLDTFFRYGEFAYIITFHDYFYGCPRVNLLDEGGIFCGAPKAEYCSPCLAEGGPHPGMHSSLSQAAITGETWRAKWYPFLAGALQCIAPSEAAAHYYGLLFPDLKLTIRPHAVRRPEHDKVALNSVTLPETAKRAKLRIAVIGTIGPHKGAARLHDLIRHCHRHEPDLHFVIVGQTDRDEMLVPYSNVEILGRYDPGTAVDKISAAMCTVALFLSIWPETYCFTLSEALSAGVMPVAFDLGAIGERLSQLKLGVLVDPCSQNNVLVQAIQLAATLPKLRSDNVVDGHYGNLTADYYEQLPSMPSAQPISLGFIQGLASDQWCERRFSLSIYTRAELSSFTLKLWCHPRHLSQNLAVRVDCGMWSRPVDTPPVSRWIASDTVTEISLPVSRGHGALLKIQGVFDFATPLDPPDKRAAAAKLIRLTAMLANGTLEEFNMAKVNWDNQEPMSLSVV